MVSNALSIFLNFLDNQAGKAVYYSLAKAYEHELGVDGKHFTAYNMVAGPFGGVSGKDLILVQSMTGRLQVFEQTATAFTRQLADCLLPAPLLYMRRLDAFVIANYTSRIECYRYQVLVNAQNDIGSANNGDAALHTTRTALVEWSLNLGEACLQMAEGKFLGAEKRSAEEILALTERSLVLIKESGVIIQQRRLDKEPACMCAYAAAPGMGHNFVVAYRDGTLQVYSDFSLVWAVTAEISPVQIAVADFGSQKGLITSLDESGRILVGFLGTRPPVTAIGGYKRELDYDKVDEEHRQLLQVIRESQSDTKAEPRDMLILRSQMSKTLDTRANVDIGEDFPQPPTDCAMISSGTGHDIHVRTTLRLFVSYSSPRPATNINVVINTPSFVHAIPSSVVISQLSGNQSTPTILHITLYASKTHLPTSLDAQAVATYVAANGEPRVAVHPFQIPLFLACKLRPAAKNNVYKLTLESSNASHPLSDLFTDFLAACQDAGTDVSEILDASGGLAVGLQFWCHAADTASRAAAKEPTAAMALNQQCSASIIMAKSGGKYRVQSDMMAVLHVLVSELSRRISLRSRELAATSALKQQQPHRFNALTYLDAMPLDPYFAVITEHFNTRLKLQNTLSQLNDQSHQFRVIEKRLLTRFKDKNPTPLSGLDSLLRETYQSVLQLADAVEEHQHSLRMLFTELECLSRLLALLATLRYDLNPMEHQALESYLCPNMSEGEELGWEEVVEASVTYLLKTTLAKNTKEYAPVQQNITMPDDTEKLTKHISMVFDRIAKGAKLIKLKPTNPPREQIKK